MTDRYDPYLDNGKPVHSYAFALGAIIGGGLAATMTATPLIIIGAALGLGGMARAITRTIRGEQRRDYDASTEDGTGAVIGGLLAGGMVAIMAAVNGAHWLQPHGDGGIAHSLPVELVEYGLKILVGGGVAGAIGAAGGAGAVISFKNAVAGVRDVAMSAGNYLSRSLQWAPGV